MCRADSSRAFRALGYGAVTALAIAIFEPPSAAQTSVVTPLSAQPQREVVPVMPAIPSANGISGPLAVLVRNPGIEPGMPPFALTDQNGVVQRYVEPAGGTDLESHLGQTVRVRHDTGQILLSTQLEFTEPGRVAVTSGNESSEGSLHSIRTAEFEEVGQINGGVVAEEIAIPVDSGPIQSSPIWLDEMASQGNASPGGCNCPQCRAARGQACVSDCPPCAGRPRAGQRWGDGPGGWNCEACDALLGEDYAQCGSSCGAYCDLRGPTCGSACGENCGCGDAWMCVRPGVIGLAEILFLRGYDSEPDSVSSKKHETGSRFELGYMNGSGRSWRVRYFEFEHPNYDGNRNLELDYWDLLYAGRFTLGRNWRGELGGGLRWSQVDDHGDNRYDHPLGPVMEIQMRSLCCGDLEAYGIARQSFQYGKEERDGFYGTFAISEMQLGLEYQRCACGGTGIGRAFLEAQSWQGVEDADSEDVGLFGFGIALGLTR